MKQKPANPLPGDLREQVPLADRLEFNLRHKHAKNMRFIEGDEADILAVIARIEAEGRSRFEIRRVDGRIMAMRHDNGAYGSDSASEKAPIKPTLLRMLSGQKLAFARRREGSVRASASQLNAIEPARRWRVSAAGSVCVVTCIGEAPGQREPEMSIAATIKSMQPGQVVKVGQEHRAAIFAATGRQRAIDPSLRFRVCSINPPRATSVWVACVTEGAPPVYLHDIVRGLADGTMTEIEPVKV